ncbi:MAG: flippase-like domain-containing protein [Deltaproteobacteria bacterium]|nr:flippase-like domain-containing protein [Deltaproteobacteria bacterium]MBW1985662.1 flippase-like domain-containing protein [Deltaproteobacteria bacterium]
MAKFKIILVVLSTLLLFWMLQAVGWDAIGRHLRLVGWYWPLILLPYLLVNLLDAISWRLTIDSPPEAVTLWHLFFNRLAGEAINVLTPTASLGGEPLKAMMLQKRGVSLTNATASVIISKGILVLSLVAYILLGLALAPFLFMLPSHWLLLLILAALGLGLAGLIFVLGQKHGLCQMGMKLCQKIRFVPRILQDQEAALCRLDAQMTAFYQHHRRKFYLALGFFLLGWLCHGLEVYLIFYLIGQPLSLVTALCLDALAILITSLAFFIPGNLGVQDGGNILLTMGLHLGAILGATFSVIRRLREGFWLAVGLVVLAYET